MESPISTRTLRQAIGFALLLLSLASPATFATTVRIQTSLGDIDIQLMDTAAPASVANFLNYVTSAAYVNSFIHRSVPGFIVQGGGFRWSTVSNAYSSIAANAPVINEFSASRSNLRGTIAMAKLGSDPNSATNQWFFNLADNSANLDNQNGGFTVFGQVIGNGMQVVDAIAALPRVNAGAPFDTLPLITVPTGAIAAQNLVMIGAITVLDTQAPAVPAGLTATATGFSQIALAWAAATDNVAVTAYKVFRDGVLRATINAPAVTFGDTGLTASTTYSYTVQACDAAGNCSAQSASAGATTSSNNGASFAPALVSGFNMLGNALTTPLNVMSLFGNQTSPIAGVTDNVASIWKWDAANGTWQFHSPLLTTSANTAYATSRGYGVLIAVNPGEGYWVNALSSLSLPAQAGSAFDWTSSAFAGLPGGFNLIAHASPVTPSQFNIGISATQPAAGTVSTGNFASLWAWDAANAKWFFYSPLLESIGALTAVKAYADSHFFQHFQDVNKKIDMGVGFWVNKF